MPIYVYKCSACGHADDVMQKMSDAALTVCPACGNVSYAKQLTAPGFALKGSGWYATDFKGGSKPAAEGTSEAKGEDKSAAKGEPKADSKSETKEVAQPAKPAARVPAPAAAGGTDKNG